MLMENLLHSKECWSLSENGVTTASANATKNWLQDGYFPSFFNQPSLIIVKLVLSSTMVLP